MRFPNASSHFLLAKALLSTDSLLCDILMSCQRLMEEGLVCQASISFLTDHADSAGGGRSLIRTVLYKYWRPKGRHLVVKLHSE